MTAKLITYLDEYKMYSISSQLFEGLTQDVVQYSERQNQQREEQRGPLASGRLLADIVGDTSGRAERKFLFDYAYTIFEQRILDDGRVLVLDENSSAEQLAALAEKSFLSVSGRLRLNDLAAIQRTTKDFNDMMAALSYITSATERDAAAALLRDALSTAQGKRRHELEKELKAVLEPKPAQSMDAAFLKNLVYMLEFGFGDHLEAQVELDARGSRPQTLFTAVLDRAALREDAGVLVKKYSRRSEIRFTVLGMVTQQSRVGAWNDLVSEKPDRLDDSTEKAALGAVTDQGHIKVSIGQMTDQIGNIEDTFFGRLNHEVIIDPIAIYRSL